MADFTIKRGTRKVWQITVPDDGSGLTFTGATIYVAVRATTDPPTLAPADDSSAIFHDSTILGGIVITDATNRVIEWMVIEVSTKYQPIAIYYADFKWVPQGESEPRSMGQDSPYTFQVVQDETRGV